MPEIQKDNGVVTQITMVEAEDGKQEEAIQLMNERAEFMEKQPGFISISLHRSLDGRRVVNYVQWRSLEELQAAHRSPQFRKEWRHFGDVTSDIDPHLYEVFHLVESKAA